MARPRDSPSSEFPGKHGAPAQDPHARDVPNLARWAALRAFGALRFLRRVQGGLEDVEGAIAARQFGVAASQARNVVLVCLSIRSLARDGELEFDDESVTFDYFAGLPPDDVAAAISLANEALDLDDELAPAWLDRFRAEIAETQRLLDAGTLPVLRSADGAFALFGLTRRWSPLLEALRLPPLLPSIWVAPGEPSAASGPSLVRASRSEPDHGARHHD